MIGRAFFVTGCGRGSVRMGVGMVSSRSGGVMVVMVVESRGQVGVQPRGRLWAREVRPDCRVDRGAASGCSGRRSCGRRGCVIAGVKRLLVMVEELVR